MSRYLIIADDITGSNDTGVQLTRRGIETAITLQVNAVGALPCSYVLDTESRALTGKESYEAISKALKQINLTNFDHVVKKVDSTLRGDIAQEILAADTALGSELVIFMPALPDLGRTTQNAVHRLHGTPITETEMARDPKTPVKEDNISKILKAVYNEPVIHVGITEIEKGEIDFTKGRVYTFDATTNAHMNTVTRAALQLGKTILWVGSASIVDQLVGVDIPQLPAMALVASLSQTSRNQVKYAIEKGTKCVSVPTYEILENKSTAKTYIRQAVELLQSGQDVIITSPADYDHSNIEAPIKIQQIMGEIAAEVIGQVKISGVFLTGGDTAMGFFEQIGASAFKVVSEVLVGIPLMQVVDGNYVGLSVITKAGAFGEADAISFSLRKLKEI